MLRSGAGDVIGTASIGEDITERKQAETEISHLNRVYAVLSGINTLIVRVRDRDELFEEACRIAVEQGEFRMAWIGCRRSRARRRSSRSPRRARTRSFSTTIQDSLLGANDAPTDTMVARAIREKRPVVSNDIDKRSAGCVFGAKRRCGAAIRSMAVLPLLIRG